MSKKFEPNKLSKKEWGFKTKSTEETVNEHGQRIGIVKGIGSVYGNVDSYGDVVMPGAFTKSIEEKGGQVPALYQHYSSAPIGINKLSDSDEGLLTEMEINLEIPQGKEAYELLKQGAINGLSIGYYLKNYTVSDKKTDDGWNIWELNEIDLREISVVTFPANEEAVVTEVKSKQEEENMTVVELQDQVKHLKDELEVATKSNDGDKIKSLTDEANSLRAQLAAKSLEEIGSGIEQLGKSNIGGAVNDNDAEEEYEKARSSVAYKNAYFKTVLGRPLSQKENEAMQAVKSFWAVDNITGNSDATDVIPTTLFNSIIEKFEETGVLFPLISKSYVKGILQLAMEESSSDATWGDTEEGATISEMSGDLGVVSFSMYKLAKIVSISRETKAMTIDVFESFVVNKLTTKIAKEIDRGIMRGLGAASNQPTGILLDGQVLPAQTINIPDSDIDAATHNRIIALIPTGYDAGAKFYMNRLTWLLVFESLLDSAGQKIAFQNPANAQDRRLGGYPVVLTDTVPAYNTPEATTLGYILFGNLQEYHMNIQQTLNLEMSTQSSFKQDLTDYKGTFLGDGKIVVKEAFAKVKNAIPAP